MVRLIFLLFIFVSFFLDSFANEIKTIDLSKKIWEYKWGDSSFENNLPLWTLKKEKIEWKKIKFPSNPPHRNGQTNVWYRVKLPDKLPNDPTLYIFSIDIISQVFLNSKKIYSYGDFKEDGTGKFQGWPWHMFSLPNNSENKYLYFRVYSDYSDIGLWGEILVSSRGLLLKKILDSDIPKIMVGSVSVFVAVLFLIAFLTKLKRYELAILGLLFLSQGLNVLCSVKVIQLYLFYPLLNQFILAFSFFFFPAGIAMFLDRTIKYKMKYNFIRRIWQIHLLYVIGALGGAAIEIFDIASTYKYFDILYNFITLPILTSFMVYYFFKGDNQIKLITSSFLIISFYWFYSSMIAYGVFPWEEYPSDVAVFLCLMLLTYSIVKNINYTKKLEEEKQELTILSSTDPLTRLFNRIKIDELLKNCESFFHRYNEKFSIILFDIDDFKKTNDTYGHLVGDKVLIEFANILIKNTRETDFVGRWGGEEFIVICPKTKTEEAEKVAEHLRTLIDNCKFDVVNKKTASLGVSTFNKDDDINSLLARADDAMYQSKLNGKNRVTIK